MLEDLIARDVAFIKDVDAIEDKHFIHLGHVLASHCAAEFGAQNDQAIAARGIKAEQDLRIIESARPTYDTLEVQAF